jgi:hypothetical protein
MHRSDYKRYPQPNEREEEHFDFQYEVKRETYFRNYIAVVAVILTGETVKRAKSIIHLYEKLEPAKGLLKFFTKDKELIAPPTKAGDTANINQMITDLIIKYELPLYQKYLVEESSTKLKFDYANEFQKQRERQQQLTVTEDITTTTTYEAPQINDFFSQPELTPEEKKEQMLLEAARKTGKDPNSLRNLLPFQSKKPS